VRQMIQGFKGFLLRGNVVDLAVAVVIGTAFGLLVSSPVADLLTPLIGAIIGEPDFGGLSFTINGSAFTYGNFLNALISFVSVAAAIYFFVVVPLERIKGPAEVETRACPECTTEIPLAARRCPSCTAQITAAG
jgi:large conductance mechanosensitive channel